MRTLFIKLERKWHFMRRTSLRKQEAVFDRHNGVIVGVHQECRRRVWFGGFRPSRGL
jgi:hypothetical protein